MMLMIFHMLQTIGIYGFANWAPTFFLKQGRSLGQSLEYSFLIALVSPIGPLISVYTAERFERKRVIVLLSLSMAISGLAFPFVESPLAIVTAGALITIFSYWFSAVLHAYQAELFPTRARATGVGFTYSWSRLSAVFSTYHYWLFHGGRRACSISFHGCRYGRGSADRRVVRAKDKCLNPGGNFKLGISPMGVKASVATWVEKALSRFVLLFI